MEPPLFVFAGEDVAVFPSAEAAAARLERLGVEIGRCDAFDSRGRRLALRVVETEQRLRGFRVETRSLLVEAAEPEPSGQAELRARLSAYLALFDLDPSYLGTAALADLVRTAAERHGVRV